MLLRHQLAIHLQLGLARQKHSRMESVVRIHDGVASHSLKIKPSTNYEDIISAAAGMTSRPSSTIALGYEASWCEKKSSRIKMHYLSNDDDLTEMARQVKRFTDEQRRKKRNVEGVACSILIRTVNDEVSLRPV